MKTKKKSGKTLRKSGKSQGKIREFEGIKKVGTLHGSGYLNNTNLTDSLVDRPLLIREMDMGVNFTLVSFSVTQTYCNLIIPYFK